jgi:hypothetical protein
MTTNQERQALTKIQHLPDNDYTHQPRADNQGGHHATIGRIKHAASGLTTALDTPRPFTV